jgi:hypothetical protein
VSPNFGGCIWSHNEEKLNFLILQAVKILLGLITAREFEEEQCWGEDNIEWGEILL